MSDQQRILDYVRARPGEWVTLAELRRVVFAGVGDQHRRLGEPGRVDLLRDATVLSHLRLVRFRRPGVLRDPPAALMAAAHTGGGLDDLPPTASKEENP